MALNNKKRFYKSIVSDLKRYYKVECGKADPPIKSKIRIIVFSYGLHALVVYRIGQYIRGSIFKISLMSILLWLIFNVLNILVTRAYGIFISPEAVLGEGIYIGHFGNIQINRCIIGKQCSFHQNTVLGTNEINTKGPVIGDSVWIGAHSFIRSDIKVGDNATIAAGSVVLRDVKENTMVMGNPARVINNRYNNSTLLGNLV